jgi:uncharacterized protein (DUF58 family)
VIWTRFAKLFLLGGVLSLGIAVLSGHRLALVLGTFLGSWVVFESLLFSATLFGVKRGRLEIERRMPELGQDAVTWTGVEVQYDAQWTSKSLFLLGSMRIIDLFPAGLSNKQTQWYGLLRPFVTVRWRGSLQTLEAGLYQLPGLSVELFSPSGLFHAFVFIENKMKLNVYPNVFGIHVARPSKKSLNRLLQLGLHRYKNKGGHGELLEIREYMPGDPIKQIAWKISARKDKLFVKELEREVPIRTTFFVDGGPTARMGRRGERPIDKMIQVVGQVARGTLEGKDPVGACLYHAGKARWVPPATGRQHLFRVLRSLAELSAAAPEHYFGQVEKLSPNIEAYLYRRYPDLMQPHFNPEPNFVLPALRGAERRRRKIERHMAAVMTLILNDGALDHCARAVATADNEEALSGLMAEFAVSENLHLNLAPDLTGRHLEVESRQRLKELARLLHLAVLRAKDNEVFICFIDYVGGPAKELLAAVRSARARHHRVLIILTDYVGDTDSPTTFIEALGSPNLATKEDLSELSERLYSQRLQASRDECLKELKRVGIPVINLSVSKNVDVVARQVAQLKWQGSAR